MELSISSKNLNCFELSNFLIKSGVMNANIVPAIGLVDTKIERSCNIKLNHSYSASNKFALSKLWSNLELEYNFKCAYLHIPGIYNGCIKDWLRKSDCPGIDCI